MVFSRLKVFAHTSGWYWNSTPHRFDDSSSWWSEETNKAFNLIFSTLSPIIPLDKQKNAKKLLHSMGKTPGLVGKHIAENPFHPVFEKVLFEFYDSAIAAISSSGLAYLVLDHFSDNSGHFATIGKVHKINPEIAASLVNDITAPVEFLKSFLSGTTIFSPEWSEKFRKAKNPRKFCTENMNAIAASEDEFLSQKKSIQGCMVKLGNLNIIEARSIRILTRGSVTMVWINAVTTSVHTLQGTNGWLIVHDSEKPGEIFTGNVLCGEHVSRGADTANNFFGRLLGDTVYSTLQHRIECSKLGIVNVNEYIAKNDPSLCRAKAFLAGLDWATTTFGQIITYQFGTHMAIEKKPPLSKLRTKKLELIDYANYIRKAVEKQSKSSEIWDAYPELYIDGSRYRGYNWWTLSDDSDAASHEIERLHPGTMSAVDQSFKQIMRLMESDEKAKAVDSLIGEFSQLAEMVFKSSNQRMEELIAQSETAEERFFLFQSSSLHIVAQKRVERLFVMGLTNKITKNAIMKEALSDIDPEEVRELVIERQLKFIKTLTDYRSVLAKILDRTNLKILADQAYQKADIDFQEAEDDKLAEEFALNTANRALERRAGGADVAQLEADVEEARSLLAQATSRATEMAMIREKAYRDWELKKLLSADQELAAQLKADINDAIAP